MNDVLVGDKMKAILCITYNNLACTKKAINSALQQDLPCWVMALDNQSTDGTREWLRSKREIASSFTTERLSLGACWNRGISAFFSIGMEEVLVINNDVVLRPDTYRTLDACNDYGFVTAVGVETEEQFNSPPALGRLPVPHPHFSCFLIRKWVWDKVGKFDESYFPAYCEDNDYHVRMHRAGVTAVCVSIPFLHLGSMTLKTASEGERAYICRQADINREKFRKKYGCLPNTPEYEALFTSTPEPASD